MQMRTPPILTRARQGGHRVVLVGVAREACLRIHRPRSEVQGVEQSPPGSPQLQLHKGHEPKDGPSPIRNPP